MNGYRPEIDGLRGIAVWLVVLHHAGLACPGGFSEGVVCVEPHVPVDETNCTMLGDRDGPYYWDDDHLSAHGVHVMFQSLLLESCLQQ
jgi:hypothetical protein